MLGTTGLCRAIGFVLHFLLATEGTEHPEKLKRTLIFDIPCSAVRRPVEVLDTCLTTVKIPLLFASFLPFYLYLYPNRSELYAIRNTHHAVLGTPYGVLDTK